MKVLYRFLWAITTVTVTTAPAGVAIAQEPARAIALREHLATALAKQDAVAIHKAVAGVNHHLGKKVGVPEAPDKYLPIPQHGKWLTVDKVAPGFERLFRRIEQLRWWRVGLDPTKLVHPLREPAAVVSGSLAAWRAKTKGADHGLRLAREAGDFLIWAQERGGTGVFPFPASRGVSQAAPFVAAERLLKQAEQAGRLDAIVRNGWVIDDDGDGGLQFDNGECGVAILELYESTQDTKYLDAARKSADWALSRPLVGNWNYNSFSVHLLTRAYRVTGDVKYLEGALKKALLGVIPGQLTQGPYAGRWNDPHNARPSYHYIMLRSLAELTAALPHDDAARPEVLAALRLGLKARNRDFLDQGAPNIESAMEVLVMVHRVFANDVEFLKETFSSDALDALAKLVSEQSGRGSASLGPRGWGRFLEFVVWKGGR